jgi:hypothetical protein
MVSLLILEILTTVQVTNTMPFQMNSVSGEILRNANNFVDKLMQAKVDDDLPSVEPGHEMRVIVDLPILGGRAKIDLIVREMNKFLWSRALDVTDKLRVCIFGTPGVGKTTSTPHLIRFILQQNRTVVYLTRSKNKSNWYYEFIPTNDVNMPYSCSIYPESRDVSSISSLQDKTACYIVDPGDTKDDCNPGYALAARVIIVASADSKHWGGATFRKRNYDGGHLASGGIMLCYSLWSLDEILAARKYLNKAIGLDLSEKEVIERYEHFGGVPRNLFTEDLLYESNLADQHSALSKLTERDKLYILSNHTNDVVTLDSAQPSGLLIGFISAVIETRNEFMAVPLSKSVLESVSKRFLQSKWTSMLMGKAHEKEFEQYAAYLMMGTKKSFRKRTCVGKGKVPKTKKIYNTIGNVVLGGCTDMKYTWDIIESARKMEKVLFCPTNPKHALIDFIYAETKTTTTGKKIQKTLHFSAFQVTTGATHEAQEHLIKEFAEAIGIASAAIYYVVPAEKFTDFVTVPASPRRAKKITMYHVSVPCPMENPKLA